MKDSKNTLAVALHGMDSRTVKTMGMFLKGPCKGAASIAASPENADVDVFDIDFPASKKMLEQHLMAGKQKPVIILSLWDAEQEGMLHVKKPINAENMLKVLEQAKKLLVDTAKKINQQQKTQVSVENSLEKEDFLIEDVYVDSGSRKSAVEEPFAQVSQHENFDVLAEDPSEDEKLEIYRYALSRRQQKSKPTETGDSLQELDDWFESSLKGGGGDE